jgi:hypothetical protein
MNLNTPTAEELALAADIIRRRDEAIARHIEGLRKLGLHVSVDGTAVELKSVARHQRQGNDNHPRIRGDRLLSKNELVGHVRINDATLTSYLIAGDYIRFDPTLRRGRGGYRLTALGKLIGVQIGSTYKLYLHATVQEFGLRYRN